jgi:endogenous inhibitor of DNA gyrase (YacG/DUF329 family)
MAEKFWVCPICGSSFEKHLSASLPFCSPRCRQIDLGRWLGEQYSVPVMRLDEDEESDERAPTTDDDDDEA